MNTRNANRLQYETSPYLRQHAHNPVDWYPWGTEALEKAKRENKPIFLSVGYSACHWCHVMERESFENEAIAALLNQNYVSIKVDREERPDIDHIYMNVVQLLTGHGGWPMSVFLAPDQTPIFGGTYFPPDDRHGMPGFPRVVQEVARLYREQPPELRQQTEGILKALHSLSNLSLHERPVQLLSLESAAQDLLRYHDAEHGGFGGAPKFPQTMAVGFLLRMARRTGQKAYLDVVTHTLTKMARGGIYDHLAGGFARYSVDDQWSVPHFEKMLYDNALLAVNYFEAFQFTHEPFYLKTSRGILDYVLSEMTSPDGAFYSSQDADSEGEEGKYYVWDPAEIRAVVGDEAEFVCRCFGVQDGGNFEHGKTVLFLNVELQSDDERRRLEAARQKLLLARQKRIAPGRDEKILTSWNALMIRGFVRGYQATLDERYLKAAVSAADFILKKMVNAAAPERLLATYKDGQAKHPAYLDDYAFFTAALLDVFQVTGEAKYLQAALNFNGVVLQRFKDARNPGFFFIADDHERLIDRPKAIYDASIPSGNSVAIENLIRLSVFDSTLLSIAEQQLQGLIGAASERPMGFANLLNVADLYLGPRQEIVVTGDAESSNWREMLQTLGEQYMPQALWILQHENASEIPGLEEILRGKRGSGGNARVYICEGQTCSAPLEDSGALKAKLQRR